MAKKLFARILPLVLVLCILLSTTAFASTTYYLEVTLTGPDAAGEMQTLRDTSSKYGSLTTPLAYEVVRVVHHMVEVKQEVFAKTGLGPIVYGGMEAFAKSVKDWENYGNVHEKDVTGEFKEILRDTKSTFDDLNVDQVNKISYKAENGDVYIVTVTLKRHMVGSDSGVCPAAQYKDVKVNDWYHDGIHYCLENGLMKGYSATVFGVDDNLTRAQVAQVLYNREGKPEVEDESLFTDVDPAAWYADAIHWASEAGIVKGHGNGEFGPEDPITREQLATMLYRYGTYKDYDLSVHGALHLGFADVDQISGWARTAVEWAYAKGILHGVGHGMLDPTGNATRAQAATMFMRFFEHH